MKNILHFVKILSNYEYLVGGNYLINLIGDFNYYKILLMKNIEAILLYKEESALKFRKFWISSIVKIKDLQRI